MGKKKFSTLGLDSILGEENKEEVNKKERSFKKEEIRATFLIEKELIEKIKAIAYWDRLLIKEVINKAFKEEIRKYEKLNGKIQEIPNK